MNLRRKSKHISKRRRKKSASTSFEKLEPRKMMATFAITGDTLEIRGTTGPDQIEIRQNASSVTASVNGTSQTYSLGNVNDITVLGFAGDDLINNATSIPSNLQGGAGDDTIIGGESADTISGHAGNDRLFGRGGDDFISGTAGTNIIQGGFGDDHLIGGVGRDFIFGEGGADYLSGNGGDDYLDAGDGGTQKAPDRVFGRTGSDTLVGGSGFNLLVGAEGNDDYVIFDRAPSDGGWDGIREFAGQGIDRVDVSRLDIRSIFQSKGREIVTHGKNRHINIHFASNVETVAQTPITSPLLNPTVNPTATPVPVPVSGIPMGIGDVANAPTITFNRNTRIVSVRFSPGPNEILMLPQLTPPLASVNSPVRSTPIVGEGVVLANGGILITFDLNDLTDFDSNDFDLPLNGQFTFRLFPGAVVNQFGSQSITRQFTFSV